MPIKLVEENRVVARLGTARQEARVEQHWVVECDTCRTEYAWPGVTHSAEAIETHALRLGFVKTGTRIECPRCASPTRKLPA